MASRGAPPAGGDIDYGWKLEVGATVTWALAAIVTGLRCTARIKYSKWGWDDTIMVLAVILGMISTVLDFVAAEYGLGRHSYYLTTQNNVDQQYWALLSLIFCLSALTCAKMSIVLAYLRILRGSKNVAQQASLWIVGVLSVLINVTTIIMYFVACHPAAKAWDPRVPGTCISVQARSGPIFLSGAYSAFSDFFLALFPFFMFRKLNMSKQTKAVILFLMGLGTFTGVFAIIRTAEYGISLFSPPTVPDTAFNNVMGMIWGGMERNIAIMAGSAPCLRPYVQPLKKLYQNTFGTSSKKSSSATPINNYQLSDRRGFGELSRGHDAKSESQTSMKQQSSGVVVTSEFVVTSEEQIYPASVV